MRENQIDSSVAASVVAEARGPVAAATPAIGIIIVSAYVAAQMIADLTSVKIGTVAGLAVDMGTFIYPITFTLRDMVHKTFGKRNAQVLIITAAVINVVMVIYTVWVASVPSDPGADPEGVFGAAYALVFGPLWRITFASIIAEVVSELADTEAYHLFIMRVTPKYQWARVLVSNAISIPLDTAIFAIIAFAPLPGFQEHFLTVPWSVVGEIFLFNVLLKFGVTLVSMPLIYLAPDPKWR